MLGNLVQSKVKLPNLNLEYYECIAWEGQSCFFCGRDRLLFLDKDTPLLLVLYMSTIVSPSPPNYTHIQIEFSYPKTLL